MSASNSWAEFAATFRRTRPAFSGAWQLTAISRRGGEPRFRSGRKTHTGALAAEVLERGMSFQIIDWSEDQGAQPPGCHNWPAMLAEWGGCMSPS